MNEFSEKITQDATVADKVWGSAYKTLPKLINKYDLKVGAEIGVAFGGHAYSILTSTKASLYCIDPYEHLNNYHDPMNVSQIEFEAMYSFTKSRLKKFGKRAKMIRNTSKNAINEIKENLDFIYLDGDHSFEGVKADINSWFIRIRFGGIIAGHDYGHESFPGVKKAVDEFFSKLGMKVNAEKSGVWWVIKSLPISYIVPAYNCETTIKDTINSIYNNFSKDDEIIIVNDASTDGTHKVINELKNKHSDLRYYKHSINRGGGATRNTAIYYAQNKLIFCLDSDNILQSGSIEKLKNFYAVNSCDGVAFSDIWFFKDSINKLSHKWKFIEKCYDRSNYLHTIYVPGASGNFLFTKLSWQKASGYPDFAGALDTWGFGLRLAMTGSVMSILPNSGYFHKIGIDSYWVRQSKIKKPSIQASRILLDYYSELPRKTREIIYNYKTRESWFENLDHNPLDLIEIKNADKWWRKYVQYFKIKI